MSAVGSFLWTEPMLLELQQRLRSQRAHAKPSRGECLAALEAWRRERLLLSELLELLELEASRQRQDGRRLVDAEALEGWARHFRVRRFSSGVVLP